MKITILANNTAKEGYSEEHGLSIYIKTLNHNILFDVGYTDVFLKNAKKIGIDLNDVKYIILSHGHYDHTGGLRYLHNIDSLKTIYLHKDAFIPKYKKESVDKYNGIPYAEDELKLLSKFYKKTSGFTKIETGIYTLSDIKNNSMDPRYTVNNRIDDFHDEQILIIEEQDGLTLFMGCSHFGVVNGVKAVMNRFQGKPIKNLVAGMHLGSKTKDEIQDIAKSFDELGVHQIIPLHCTGELAIKLFKTYFMDRCILVKAGDQLDIEKINRFG